MKRRYLVEFGCRLEGKLPYAEVVEVESAVGAVMAAIMQAKDNKRFPYEPYIINELHVKQLSEV